MKTFCSSPCRTWNATKGFSLVEVMAALAILAFSTVTLIQLSPLRRSVPLTVQTATSIKELLVEARTSAQVTGTSQRVVFDLARRRVFFQRRSLSLPASLSLELLTAKELSLPGSRSVLFFADGSGSGATVLLKDGHQQTRLQVSWLTGSISDESE